MPLIVSVSYTHLDVYKRQRECRADIFDFALRILEAEDKHMLSLPALFPALIRYNVYVGSRSSQSYLR